MTVDMTVVQMVYPADGWDPFWERCDVSKVAAENRSKCETVEDLCKILFPAVLGDGGKVKVWIHPNAMPGDDELQTVDDVRGGKSFLTYG